MRKADIGKTRRARIEQAIARTGTPDGVARLLDEDAVVVEIVWRDMNELARVSRTAGRDRAKVAA